MCSLLDNVEKHDRAGQATDGIIIGRMRFAFCVTKATNTHSELSPLFVQLMHINYYKIVTELKSFKFIIVAPACFGLHKPSSGSSQPVLR